MARKRKAAIEPQEPSGPAELDPRDARKRIRTFEDVADSDDEFHLNQDEVRLGEDPEGKRRRRWAEQEEFLEPSDEEVLGYSEDEDDEDDEEVDGEHDGASFSATKRTRGVAGAVDDEIDDEDYEEGLRWGTSKADLYGADTIETEQQALEEEAEALRLQRKQLASMKAADYGFDEADWQEDGPVKDRQDQDEGVVTEVLPQLQIPPDLSAAERLKLLKTRYPEFDPLSRELLQLQEVLPELKKSSSAVSQTKFRAASAYLGALTIYFSLLTSTAFEAAGDQAVALPASELRDHPVMDSLMKCREFWLNVARLSDESSVAGRGSDDADEEGNSDLAGESEASLEVEHKVVKAQPAKTRAERYAEAQQAAADARKVERIRRTEAGLADLDALLTTTQKLPKKLRRGTAIPFNGHDSDLGEEAPLTVREAADKAKQKKSLRFYTSQIAQKANKRGAAGNGAGGDDDVPHRERLRDRQARLNAEAEKRGRGKVDPSTDLGGESDEDDHRQAQALRHETANDDDYYDLIAAKTAKKKSDKAALAEAQRRAALEGGRVIQQDVVEPDGKRKVTYAIEKNKGLTPHRNKDNRNPRVKKRKKFEEKKKKLASMKPIYKGGEGRGGYGGELTGIKTGLVKSTKL